MPQFTQGTCFSWQTLKHNARNILCECTGDRFHLKCTYPLTCHLFLSMGLWVLWPPPITKTRGQKQLAVPLRFWSAALSCLWIPERAVFASTESPWVYRMHWGEQNGDHQKLKGNSWALLPHHFSDRCGLCNLTPTNSNLWYYYDISEVFFDMIGTFWSLTTLSSQDYLMNLLYWSSICIVSFCFFHKHKRNRTERQRSQ